MANVDVKWPSEDEEFDTVATAVKNEQKKTEGQQITVNSGDGDNQPSLAPETSEDTSASQPEQPAEQTEAQNDMDEVSENTADQSGEAAQPAPADEPKPEAPVEEDKPTVTDKEPDNELAKVAPVVAAPAVAKVAKGKGHFGRLLVELLLVALVAGLAFWGYGLQNKNKELNAKVSELQQQVATLNNNPAIVEQRKTDELVSKVAALMELPKTERPQAALVSDATALKKQYPFFANVQNGDQILFYYQAGKVIVYRPTTNKIVQTGPLSISQAAAPAANTQQRR